MRIQTNKTTMLILATVMTLILAAAAIATSFKLKQLSTVPVAPNVPLSQPRAAATFSPTTSGGLGCQLMIMPTYAPGCYESCSGVAGDVTTTLENKCGSELECRANPNKTLLASDWICVNPNCPSSPDCVCPTSTIACTAKVAYRGTVAETNKLTAGAAVNRGDVIVYEIGYANSGSSTGTITVTDTLPAGVEFVSADEGCVRNASVVTCANVGVAAGASGAKKITVKVASSATAGELNNIAVVTPATGQPSNCAIKLTVPTYSALRCTTKSVYKSSVSVTNKLAADSTVSRGDTLVYEIGYTNSGDGAGRITIVDALPNKVEFVSADEGCVNSSGVVTCADIDVAAGASGTKKITVKVLSSAAAGEFENTAKITPSSGEATNCAVKLKLTVPTETVPKCDDSCNSNSDCPSDLKCVNNKCRNEKCSGETDCSCPLACNDYCANDSQCPSGMKCSWNKCRNTQCPDDNDCNCGKPPGCDETCNPNNATNECVGGYVCDKTTKTCRNAACSGETDCTCAIQAAVTASSESLPDAGSPVPGFVFLAAGAILLVLGVLVVGL